MSETRERTVATPPTPGRRARRAAVPRRSDGIASRVRRGLASAAVGVIAGVTIFGLTGGSGALFAGGARAVADDSSAVTVTAKDQDADVANAPFPELAVTVSQTRALESQGIVVSWTGGRPSTVPSSQIGGADFLQVFQCWGDDPDHPGTPDRTTCQYGLGGVPGSHRDDPRDSDASVAAEDERYTVPGDGFATPTYTSIPFRAANGRVVANVVDGKYSYTKDAEGEDVLADMNTNEFFSKYTTNMVSWAGSGGDGSGSVKFEVQTALQSQGLGCGSPRTAADGTVTGSSCWLVILPRGAQDGGASFITKSGLFWDTWKHRIAVKLDFKPLGVRCPIGASERQLAGSELISRAISSWQPAVCNQQGGSVYSAITGAESDAARAANGTAPAPLALTSRPLDPSLGADALRYAPVAITGAAISFAIDRNPRPGDDTVPPDMQKRVGLPFTSLKLTPRLVAKLLTNSYLDSLPTFADRDHLSHLDGKTRVYNPRTLVSDPDFLAINDAEWKYQALAAASLADALVPQGRSDAAWAIWQYVLSDQSAREFLEGAPDEWGMTVNPWSATGAETNASGTGLTLPREDFPKADPVEQAATSSAGPVNLVTWRPYINDLDAGAYDTLRGDGLTLGAWDPISTPPKYGKAERSLPGRQTVIAVTDAASAARYQIVTAALQNPAGEFVTVTTESMAAAATAMTADSGQGQVVSFDPTSPAAVAARGAYPLTMPVYAAVNPKVTDAELRSSYAAFIRYAATEGQQPGTAIGQLPQGYLPLPDAWRTLATAAADDIEAGRMPTTGDVEPPASPTTPAAGIAFPGGGVVGSAPAAAAVAASGAVAAPAAADPVASGSTAPSRAGGTTPADPDLGALPAALPASVAGGLASAFAVPLLGRLRRRL